jgi:hypothetical protein
MMCDKQEGVEQVPTYVNFGLRKRFRKGTPTYVGNCLNSAATTMQAIHFRLSLDFFTLRLFPFRAREIFHLHIKPM